MPNLERTISRGERSAIRQRNSQIARQAQAEEQADRKAFRLHRFDTLNGRNRELSERAGQLLSRYGSLTEYSRGDCAFVLLKDPAADSKMWPMGVVTRRSTSYSLGIFATDSARVVASARAGELHGNGAWQLGLEEEHTYSDSERPSEDDYYTEFMTHIPAIGQRFAVETRPFAPVKAIQRAYWAGAINRRLVRLEGTMDLIESAAADVQLNPGLAQTLEPKAA